MLFKKTFLYLFTFAVSLIACDTSSTFKDHQDIEDGLWYVKNEPSFTFEITDTAQAYNVYYLVRNAVQYPYYNLYVKRFLLNDKNKVVNEALNELILMDERTGKPLGDGLGDLFDHKIIALKDYRFPQPGKYTFKIRQYMRQDPLPGVLSMGLSVEPTIKEGK
ncbi:MAG: gliding motility lipoprotein GldH [Spirosomataceae bacterium]